MNYSTKTIAKRTLFYAGHKKPGFIRRVFSQPNNQWVMAQGYHLQDAQIVTRNLNAFDSSIRSFTTNFVNRYSFEAGKSSQEKDQNPQESSPQRTDNTEQSENKNINQDMQNTENIPQEETSQTTSSTQNTQEGKKRRRIIPPKKDVITLTPSAIDRVKYLLSKKKDAIGLAVGVRRRGCNGLSYTLDYVTNEPEPGKFEIVETDQIKIYVDQTALFYVLGTEMDYIENEVEAKFEWRNPKAKSFCGCGESFNV